MIVDGLPRVIHALLLDILVLHLLAMENLALVAVITTRHLPNAITQDLFPLKSEGTSGKDRVQDPQVTMEQATGAEVKRQIKAQVGAGAEARAHNETGARVQTEAAGRSMANITCLTYVVRACMILLCS
jgi:hypothetical protein